MPSPASLPGVRDALRLLQDGETARLDRLRCAQLRRPATLLLARRPRYGPHMLRPVPVEHGDLRWRYARYGRYGSDGRYGVRRSVALSVPARAGLCEPP